VVESASAGSSSSSGKRAPASAANGLPEQETQGTGCPGGRRRGPGKHSLPAEERGRSDSGEGIQLHAALLEGGQMREARLAGQVRGALKIPAHVLRLVGV